MDEEELINMLEEIKTHSSNKIHELKINYDNFVNFYKIFLNQFGEDGVLMILEKTATLTFFNYKNIRFLIRADRLLVRDDFKKYLKKVKVIGAEEKYSFKNTFIQDIKNNFKLILVLSIVYFFIYNSFMINKESLVKLNDHLVDITNIFIAAFFVFIAFFNGEKEKILELYRKGNCDKFNFNDKYIFKLSVTALMLVVLSNGILYFHFGYENTIILMKRLRLNKYINMINIEILKYAKYNLSFILTWISIIFLIICFDSILNYYLNKIRNNYFLEAFENEINKKQ